MNYFLSVYLSPNLPITHKLNLVTYIIGRHSSCNILILDKFVSRWHCTLVLMPPDKYCRVPYYSLMDGLVMGEKSGNGTWVNGKIINYASLKHQDTITFGNPQEYPYAVFTTDSLEEKPDDGTFSNFEAI
jgi:pSer/pThr/pTyr-binding forkhead associated (FHA) protein